MLYMEGSHGDCFSLSPVRLSGHFRRTMDVLVVVDRCYFVLELFGFARLSMVWINLLGWSIFNLQMLYVIFRSR